MRISDWSSDVCSSDLRIGAPRSEGPASRLVDEGGVGAGRSETAVIAGRIETAFREILTAQHRADQNDGGPFGSVRSGFADGAERRPHDPLIRPACAPHYGRGAIGAMMRDQVAHHLGQVMDGKDRKRTSLNS